MNRTSIWFAAPKLDAESRQATELAADFRLHPCRAPRPLSHSPIVSACCFRNSSMRPLRCQLADDRASERLCSLCRVARNQRLFSDPRQETYIHTYIFLRTLIAQGGGPSTGQRGGFFIACSRPKKSLLPSTAATPFSVGRSLFVSRDLNTDLAITFVLVVDRRATNKGNARQRNLTTSNAYGDRKNTSTTHTYSDSAMNE